MVCAIARRAHADDSESPPPTATTGSVTLKQCLALAEGNHPDIAVAHAKLARVRAQLDEAHFAPFSQFKMTGGMSLAPTVRGNNVFSPNTDVSLTTSLGVAWRLTVSGVVPLWTFGKIGHLWEAAEAHVAVQQAAVEVARDAVRFDVRKAFMGLQLARDGLSLLADAQAQVDKAAARLEKEVDNDEADPIDLLKMRTFAAELEVRRAGAQRYATVALAGLRFYTGRPRLKVRDTPLELSKHRIRKLEQYALAAKSHRPEVAMAQAGVAARTAQLQLARARLFPDIGLGLSAGLTAAPEVANQINPFVKDNANFFNYGAALVFEWKMDVAPGLSRVAQARAQLREVEALNRKANVGVSAEVADAYANLIDWQTRLKAYQKAERYARQWLVTVRQAIDIGTMDDKDLIDPAKAAAEHRYNVLNATMQYNLAIAKLAKVTGWDAIAPGG